MLKVTAFFCGHEAKFDGKKKGYDVFPVRTKDFQISIAKCCKERQDDWSSDVSCRFKQPPCYDRGFRRGGKREVAA